jgi:uncharacterized protein YuzE
MRLSYHPDTDSLYIHLTEKPGADVVEVSDGVVVDVDQSGVPVGIDIDTNASKIVDLTHLEFEGLRLNLRLEEVSKTAAR